jgi:hypothetical protein
MSASKNAEWDFAAILSTSDSGGQLEISREDPADAYLNLAQILRSREQATRKIEDAHQGSCARMPRDSATRPKGPSMVHICVPGVARQDAIK